MTRRFSVLTSFAPVAAILCLGGSALAQGTLDDYRRAATMGQITNGKVVGLVQGTPTWIDSSRFWYRVSVAGGSRFVLVDADGWNRQPAFDHARLAQTLSRSTKAQFGETSLPFTEFMFANQRRAIELTASGSRWRCGLGDYVCERLGPAPDSGTAGGRGGRGRGGAVQTGIGGNVVANPGDDACTPATDVARGLRLPRGRGAGPGQGGVGNNLGRPPEGTPPDAIRSPDGKWFGYIESDNVAVRPADGGSALRLSTDGKPADAYRLQSMQWSPDSKKLVVYRQTEGTDRRVTYVVSSPAPAGRSDGVQPCVQLGQVYRKPGDVLPIARPVLFDIESRTQTVIDNALFGNPYQVSVARWRRDSRAFTFEFNQRGHMAYRVLEVNGATGAARALIDEGTKSFFFYRPSTAGLTESGGYYRFDVDDGREIIWMSERDGWQHLYLYDGVTGSVKNQITKGEWVVKSVDSVDVTKRQIYFRALGRNAGQDPYFFHFYRINFDGTGLVAYTEGNGTHAVAWSPDRRYYTDTYSRVDMPPAFELRRASDRRMLPLEKGDMSAAISAGWRPPEVFVAKGRDGTTDIWGLIVRPHTFDPAKKYPVIESIYAGPQGSFVPKAWGGGQGNLSVAELGFVVAQIDGMGTANRSKAFHDRAWKNLGDAGFEDRILWHKAVAAKYPWYDISRVGTYGGSAGGQNAAGALLFHGDFYKAAFASSGCHDNRMDKIWWNELWMGEMGPHYAASSNVVHAPKLTGHLFLAVGEYDNNVDPSSTLQVVDALVRAGKDFDLLVVPNGGHGATGPTGTRKRNDFFVRWLLGVTPPNWNSGITVGGAGGRAGGPGFGAGSNLQFPDDEPHPYGFFESPADNRPPFWWW